MSRLPIYALDIDEKPDGEGFVFAVGLVDQPATERMWRVFEAAKEYKLTVSNEEQRILAGPLMVADQPIYRRDPDGREYYVSFPAKSIAKIVNKYTRSREPLAFNLDHNDANKVNSCHLQQHFIINKAAGINTPEGFAELPDGSWFGFVKVEDPAEWEEAKKRGGFSVEGYFNEVKILEAPQELYENLKNQLNKMKTNFKDMFNAIKKEFFPDAAAPIELAVTALADGSGSIKGTLEQGQPVMFVDATGAETPAEGEYMLAGGIKITCQAGTITAIETEGAPAAMNEADILQAIQTALETQATAFKAQVDELKTAHSAELKTVTDKFNEQFKKTFELMELLGSTEKPLPKADDPKGKSVEKHQGNMKKFYQSLGNMKEQATA